LMREVPAETLDDHFASLEKLLRKK
jgi:hypothetical protein